MKVYLAEKPSQGKDIAEVLGSRRRGDGFIETVDGVVTWAIGHLLELAPPEEYDKSLGRWNWESLPIIPPAFRWIPKEKTKPQLKVIRELLKKASAVVVATDADREGEMIAREVLDYCKFKGSISRLWLSALDPESIKAALQRLKNGSETEPLYHAARARSQADWLVGMNLTRGLTVRMRQSWERQVISIGRVQTPTLGLVVRRDREIANFVSRDYFEIAADVAAGNGTRVKLRYAPRDEDRMFERSKADSIAAAATGTRGPLKVEVENKRQGPPKLFSLAGLQIKANKAFGWGADETLRIAQALYEKHKLTTYPRTDSEFLPEEQIGDVAVITAHLLKLNVFKDLAFAEPVFRKTVFNTAKVSAHHAIIPTRVPANLSSLSAEERDAYLLIARSYLAALMPDYQWEQTRITLKAGGVVFAATGNVPLVPGWKAVFGAAAAEEQEESAVLPKIPDGTPALVEKTAVEGKKTEPPAYYTEGTLIADMKSVAKFVADPARRARLKETSGIGTEATRAGILETLKGREYLTAKGKKVVSTEKGQGLIELLEKHLPALTDPGETAVWEDGFEEIIARRGDGEKFVAAVGKRVGEYLDVLGGKLPATANGNGNGTRTTSATNRDFRGKPILDGGDRWVFRAVAGTFRKVISKRPMSIDDYISIFEAPSDRLPFFEGFVSGSGRAFEANLQYNADRLFKDRPAPGVEFVFSRCSD